MSGAISARGASTKARWCMRGWGTVSLSSAITLVVFVPFALFYMNQPLKLDYLWASLCIMGAVYFIFRG